MVAISDEPRSPVRAEARLGFVLAALLWVVLSAVLAFGHHLLVGPAATVVGGTNGQLGVAFREWLPHSALGYLLLITIGIDVFIDMRNAKINHAHAWFTLGVEVLLFVGLIFLEIAEASFLIPTSLVPVISCLPMKYFSLREYKW